MTNIFKIKVNGQLIEASDNKDILSIALLAGIKFPHNCLVGGCAACKCKLTSGSVKELTDTSYLFSKEELEEGYILACQSIPTSDLEIEMKSKKNINKEKIVSKVTKASLFDYLKFFLFHIVGIFSIFTILAGGKFISIGLISVLAFYILGDAFLGEDKSVPDFKNPKILTLQLWLALPLLIVIVFLAVWSVGHTEIAWYHLISLIILVSLMIGMIGTITAHELIHRTWDKISLFIGRWLLAFSFDTIFSIEHVYGHHLYVSTKIDPATAPRGRNVYKHILYSTINGNISAWKIESERLAKKNISKFSSRNLVIRGHMMSLILVAVAYFIGDIKGAFFFVLVALFGKALLEIVNYMEHYGIVRDPNDAVNPRHSWNTNKRISSWSMFNLTRHSHHHADGVVPYHQLQPLPDSPLMINGYLTTIVIALIPPLWFKLMKPKLSQWDTLYASENEKKLIRLI